MSKHIVRVALLAVGLFSLMLTGCKKEQSVPAADEVKKAAEQATPVLPSAQKPKDHPAH